MNRWNLRPACLAPAVFVLVSLTACDDASGPVYGSSGGGSLASTELRVAGGDGQTAATLGTFSRPLTVVALRGDTLPVRGLPIEWEVVAGGATLSAVRMETDASGEASVLLTAGPVLGQVRVRTRRRDSNAAGPEFLLRTTAWGVRIEPDALVGPFGRDTLEVVAGDTVEWVNRDVAAHALATRESPAGGSLIRSGRVGNSERYRWVPNVPGVWVYEDTLATSITPRLGAVRAVDRLAVGELRVIVTQQGESLFPGFVVLLDSGAFRSAVDANASVLFSNLSATTHLVQLLTEDPACAVSGANPQLVGVPEGGRLSILFEVFCG